MIAQAYRIVHEDAGYIPLHQQSLVWGVSSTLSSVLTIRSCSTGLGRNDPAQAYEVHPLSFCGGRLPQRETPRLPSAEMASVARHEACLIRH